MSNNKQSSIEWLYNKMYEHRGLITIEEWQQAKAMHEDEVKEAWDKGDYCIDLPDGTWEQKYKSAEQYYNETFNTKEK